MKNLTTILGGIFLAVGPQIQQQLASSHAWYAGALSSIIGALLISARGFFPTIDSK